MLKLKRFSKNPIIKPNPKNWWEANSVFNPGVVYDGKKIHMLYRAMGGDRVSRFGYCYSEDGINFKGFKDLPVFESEPNDIYERLGCEDPRITKIDDTYYITYTAVSLYPATYPKSNFSTSAAPFKVRVSLLSTKDFQNFTRHGIILPDIDSKDAVLFPEKINNQYVLLHRIWPDLWIAYSKDMKYWYDQKIIMKIRPNSWDSLKIGAGSNMLKTEYGWLNFYHGIDKKKVYRLGIILLDLDNPSKVIYRSENPILEPEKEFEKTGFVSNVVFTCGAIEKDDEYYVYYAGADKYICLATIKKEELLKEITEVIRK